MVRLSDEHVRQVYGDFMVVYIEEADEATLRRLGFSAAPDASGLGFCEMMTIKLGARPCCMCGGGVW